MIRSHEWTHLLILTREAIQDAIRRRVVLVVLAICFLCLMMLNTCTSCEGQMQVEGNAAQGLDAVAWAGFGVFGVLGLWTITLAGLLAADQLTQSLADGSAVLILSRPVGRASYAVSRLLGSLAVSLGAGLVLLFSAGFMLATRSGLAPGPAITAALFCVGNSVAIASLAMAASLYLPRVAVFLMVLATIAVTSSINLASVAGSDISGIYALIDRMGPPLASSITLALSPWSGSQPHGVGTLDVVFRTVFWAGLGVTILTVAFRRWDIVHPTDR